MKISPRPPQVKFNHTRKQKRTHAGNNPLKEGHNRKCFHGKVSRKIVLFANWKVKTFVVARSCCWQRMWRARIGLKRENKKRVVVECLGGELKSRENYLKVSGRRENVACSSWRPQRSQAGRLVACALAIRARAICGDSAKNRLTASLVPSRASERLRDWTEERPSPARKAGSRWRRWVASRSMIFALRDKATDADGFKIERDTPASTSSPVSARETVWVASTRFKMRQAHTSASTDDAGAFSLRAMSAVVEAATLVVFKNGAFGE